jgi:hypothetical protein
MLRVGPKPPDKRETASTGGGRVAKRKSKSKRIAQTKKAMEARKKKAEARKAAEAESMADGDQKPPDPSESEKEIEKDGGESSGTEALFPSQSVLTFAPM